MSKKKAISFIGAGNVATQLAKAFANSHQVDILQICTRHQKSADALANQINAEGICSVADLEPVDYLIIAVPDDAITSVYQSLQNFDSCKLHTSGVTGLVSIGRDKGSSGYFYPLQTFNKTAEVNLKETPLFVNHFNEEIKSELETLAKIISNKVSTITDEQKKALHVSAVVVNNFVNHLFGLTKQFLTDNELDFTYLKPIIETTIHRALTENPLEIQTGPAIRDDETTIKQHLKLLESYPELANLYQSISESIQNVHRND